MIRKDQSIKRYNQMSYSAPQQIRLQWDDISIKGSLQHCSELNTVEKIRTFENIEFFLEEVALLIQAVVLRGEIAHALFSLHLAALRLVTGLPHSDVVPVGQTKPWLFPTAHKADVLLCCESPPEVISVPEMPADTGPHWNMFSTWNIFNISPF